MRTVGIGIIGCGARLRCVMSELRQVTDQAQVVALADPDPEAIRAACEQFNVDANVYTDYQALLSDPAVDWVMIGSWNSLHAEQAIAALHAGKHVFCEKPLAITVDDCLAMRKAWQASKQQFIIGFTLRYSPHYRKIKELVDGGAIGQLISLEFNETLDFNHGGFIHADWRRHTRAAGPHILEKCCHDVDIVNGLTGSLAVRAASFGGCDFFTPRHADQAERVGRTPQGIQGFMSWQGPHPTVNPFTVEKDIVDNQVAILEYANGVRATFHTNCAAGIPERRVYLCGTEGALRADVLTGQLELRRIGFDTAMEDYATGASGGHGDGDPVLANALAQTMLCNAQPETTLEDGLTAAFTCLGIDEAMRTGTIFDLRPWWERAGIPLCERQ